MKNIETNPIISIYYRDNIVNELRHYSGILNSSVDELVDSIMGEKKEYPFIDFYEIDRLKMNKEINKVLTKLTNKDKLLKSTVNNFKSYLRNLKKI